MTTFHVRSAKQFASKFTARIQKSGKLGFGEKESSQMKLKVGTYVKFLSANPDIPITHIVVMDHQDDDAFELRAGSSKYPFLDTKQLFDFYEIPYEEKTYFLDLTRDPDLDNTEEALSGEVYKVIFRTKDNKSKEDENVTE